MTNNIIQSIKDKYITKTNVADEAPKPKGNVQAQINKIRAIEEFVRRNGIGISELNRLEVAVNSLHTLIRKKSG